MQDNYNGIVEDTRSDEEKLLDYKHEEIASAFSPIWEERQPKKFTIFNQDGSLSCVANACAKMLGIDEVYEGRKFVDLSRRDIYTRRANKNTGGMGFIDAMNICKNHGATYETLVPSENKGETDMNKVNDINEATDKIALKYRSKGYVQLPIDIEQIASITSQGKGVLLFVKFDYNEWTNIPSVNPLSKNSCKHGICAVDNVIKDGKKYIVIDDSWSPHSGLGGQRYLSEEFLKAKCFAAGYTLNLILEPELIKPTYFFTDFMHFRDRSNEIKHLQKCLQSLGLFPKNCNCTGFFGAITLKAVKGFQRQYDLKVDGIVGNKTLAVLNQVFKK